MDKAQAKQQSIIHKTLSHPERMMLLDEICRNPGSSFNELSEKLKIPKGLLAYHLAFLRRVALVDLEYERRGKKVSSYTPTKGGLEVQKRIKDESK